jgi:inhibitor of KinA
MVMMSEECVLVEFGTVIADNLHDQVMHLYSSLNESPFVGFIEAVPAYSSLAVFFDPFVSLKDSSERQTLFASLEALMKRFKDSGDRESSPVIKVPTRFGGRNGPDLRDLAKNKGISESALIDLFVAETYKVYMIGFRPGFPYMGTVSERLAADRLVTPRMLVPAGSVGIAGRQTGIYPVDSPGGWRIIGNTGLRLLDFGNKSSPATLNPGDLVRFEPI